jgi:hypothetical protein
LTKLVFFVCTRCNIDANVWLQIRGFTQFIIFSRFLGSFGRAGSVEDVSDAGREHGDGDIQSPAELWTSKIQRVQPGMKVAIGCMPPMHNQVFSDSSLLQRYFTCFIHKILVSEVLKPVVWCMLLLTYSSLNDSFLCVGRSCIRRL